MSIFEDYTFTLCTTNTYEKAFDAYCNYVQMLGYQSATYSFIPRMALQSDSVFLPQFPTSKPNATNLDDVKEYAKARHSQEDNILKRIKNSPIKIIDWWEAARKKQLTAEQEQTLYTMRHDYQLVNGLSILVNHKKGTGASAANIVSHDDDPSFQKLKVLTQDKLCVSTILFHNHIITNAYQFNVFTEPLLTSFSQTEKKVIKALPKGTTVSAIAKDLNKSPRYIDNVIRKLRKKVGGETIDGKPRISTGLLIYYIGLMHLIDQF